MILSKIAKNLTPLCYLPSGNLVCYSRGDIFILENGKIRKRLQVFSDLKEKVLGRSRVLSRLFRVGVRAALALDEQNILLSIGNMIYELDLDSEKLSEGYCCGDSIRPLSFTEIKGISTIKDGVYFGGYLDNKDKNPVSVYRRVRYDMWEIIYTFPQGVINHVHSIVQDPYRDCLWILTGDFDMSSAIWRVTDNFQSVEIVCCNDQKYRSCIAFAISEGLLYATDAPFAQNAIYLMRPDYSLCELNEIKGSCIYGCQWRDKYVFSTTVEGDGRNTSKWEFYFGRKRGVGIKDEYVHMYCGNLTTGFVEIYNEKKDRMPYYTFQFGVFKFPSGLNSSKQLYFQSIATNKNDLCLSVISID